MKAGYDEKRLGPAVVGPVGHPGQAKPQKIIFTPEQANLPLTPEQRLQKAGDPFRNRVIEELEGAKKDPKNWPRQNHYDKKRGTR